MFWFVKCLKSQTWLKYIVQPSCLLYPESRYVYICVPVSGAFVSRYLYPSRRCREPPPGSGTIIISSPDSCIYPPIILPTCPCLTTTKVSQKAFLSGKPSSEEVVQKYALTAGRKSGWNTVAKKWAPGQNSVCGPNVEQCRGLPEIRLVPYFPIRGQLWAVRAWPKKFLPFKDFGLPSEFLKSDLWYSHVHRTTRYIPAVLHASLIPVL